tara:strand:+ start:89 stop:1018 length:930 start_codon:yes stop_codon:yes gene_type:complete
LNSKLINSLVNKIECPSKIKISLPEKDGRVDDAVRILLDMGLRINDPELIDKSDSHIKLLKNLDFSKNWPEENLIEYLNNPFISSLVMLRNHEIDGVVCGCTMPSSEVIRNSIRVVGLHQSTKWLSSMFFMVNKNEDKFFSFADCAVIPEPTSDQLCNIAENTSQIHNMLTEENPKVAFLSFSTKGSANHYRVNNVKKAVEIFSKRNPKIIHEGEIQLDAAIDFNVSNKKIKDSKLKGDANILIFPNLDAGNIGYKLVQRFGEYFACGPILLGLNYPVNDLSRGASVEDIVLITLITAIQAEKRKNANI